MATITSTLDHFGPSGRFAGPRVLAPENYAGTLGWVTPVVAQALDVTATIAIVSTMTGAAGRVTGASEIQWVAASNRYELTAGGALIQSWTKPT